MQATGCSEPPTSRESGMAENKTKATKASVTEFINSIDDKLMRADARKAKPVAGSKRVRVTGTIR